MASAPPQMRRIPDEQFFDLRNWSADKAFVRMMPEEVAAWSESGERPEYIIVEKLKEILGGSLIV